jgi:hypothetical protein
MSSRVVCGVGVPHVPVFPSMAGAGNADVRARYAAVQRVLERADPSLMVVIANDHLNAFFLDCLPTFAIDLGESTRGPVDLVPGIPIAPISTDPAAAASLGASLVSDGYDLAHCREVTVDHSVVVPLHFLNPAGVPAVILFVNAFVPPMPAASRCHRLGTALGAAIEALPGNRRVGVIASGSFSQEVGGWRVDEGRSWSVPRPDWASQVSDALTAGDVKAVIAEATPDMLADAGSVAGELLSWIAMAGAIGLQDGDLEGRVDHRPGEAFAFASWTRG